jgi:hypothetical protein
VVTFESVNFYKGYHRSLLTLCSLNGEKSPNGVKIGTQPSCMKWNNTPFVNIVPIVADSKSRNIPEVVFVKRWAVGVLGIWKGWDSWVKGGANRVSLQAT